MDHSYRRVAHRAAYLWHFCVNCSGWPRNHYVAQGEPPAEGDVCHECAARHATGSCAGGCGQRAAAAGAVRPPRRAAGPAAPVTDALPPGRPGKVAVAEVSNER
ncbi:MAG: hypothetical protein HZA24_11500 [Nitrospirae bacterium]|nr:hypothetical protein [Nitrospirota bacterium]